MKNSFGENLKRERLAAGFTQAQLAEKIGTTQQLLCRWELDEVEPTLGSLIAIMRALNVKFEDLVDMEDDPLQTRDHHAETF